MPLYYPGLTEAIEKARKMSEPDLLQTLDDLYGRDNLPENYTTEELLYEVVMQIKRDFTDTTSPEYEQVKFWTNVAKAGK